MGGPQSFLSLPKSYQLINPDGIGRRSEFVNGFIYWHPDTGAHSVSIPVSVVWQRHGWEGGFLGYPTISDMALGDQWFKHLSKEATFIPITRSLLRRPVSKAPFMTNGSHLEHKTVSLAFPSAMS